MYPQKYSLYVQTRTKQPIPVLYALGRILCYFIIKCMFGQEAQRTLDYSIQLQVAPCTQFCALTAQNCVKKAACIVSEIGYNEFRSVYSQFPGSLAHPSSSNCTANR